MITAPWRGKPLVREFAERQYGLSCWKRSREIPRGAGAESETKPEALLLGRIHDDRGHKMTPSHVRKRGIKYRYYISSALLQGQAEQAGSVSRIPADEIESLVVKTVRGRLDESSDIENALLIHNHVVRVDVQS